MRPIVLIMLALLVPAASDATVRKMGWDDSVNGPLDHSPYCGALPDQSVIVVGFQPTISDLTGLQAYIDFCTRPYVVPGWWRFSDPQSCRADSLTVTIDFADGPTHATVPWSEQATVFHFVEYPFYGDDKMARIWVTIDDPGLGPGSLTPGEEYYAFKVVFGNPDTGCEDCETPACFVLNGMSLNYSEGIDFTEMDLSNWAMWQGGTYNCPFIVQTERFTWGRVKALFR